MHTFVSHINSLLEHIFSLQYCLGIVTACYQWEISVHGRGSNWRASADFTRLVSVFLQIDKTKCQQRHKECGNRRTSVCLMHFAWSHYSWRSVNEQYWHCCALNVFSLNFLFQIICRMLIFFFFCFASFDEIQSGWEESNWFLTLM